ncbi:MAG: alpha/beta hydrolase [Bacillota bacterium]|nr:alpha/beta hydrolase [Bacillota bacterium]
MSLKFTEMGDRSTPAIVLVHGGGLSGWMWQKQWEALSDYHLLIPDLPGHGRLYESPCVTVEEGAGLIADLIRQQTREGKAHVVGHSLGGMILAHLLGTQPDLINRAVIASAMFRPQRLSGLLYSRSMIKKSLQSMQQESGREKRLTFMAFPNDFYRDNYIREAKTHTVELFEGIYGQLKAHTTLPRGLEKVETPTLVIAGEKEVKPIIQTVQDLTRALPNAAGCFVKNGKHTFPWENSTVFNTAIRSWLTGMTVDNPEIIFLRR